MNAEELRSSLAPFVPGLPEDEVQHVAQEYLKVSAGTVIDKGLGLIIAYGHALQLLPSIPLPMSLSTIDSPHLIRPEMTFNGIA